MILHGYSVEVVVRNFLVDFYFDIYFEKSCNDFLHILLTC